MSLQDTQDGKKEIQKRTFTRWMNVYLSRRDPPTEVHDLFRDIQDGRILMMLLEELTGCKLLYRFRSSSHRIFRLNNISKALAFLDDRHVKLLGIDASSVADGVSSVVLHLVWNIILHFQVKEMTGGLRRRLSSSLSSLSMGSDLSDLTDESIPNSGWTAAKSPKYNGKTIKRLLHWVQRCTAKFGVEVHDFGRSWRNGLAFLALIKSINPDLVDLKQRITKDPKENLDQAFRTAHQSLDIPPLLEPQDVLCRYPDEKSIITYVSMILRHCPNMVEDLSAAATSPHISKFRSLETLEDREDAEPVFSSFEASYELLLWKRWARRSSNSTLQNRRKSPSVHQPPSPLDANVVNPEIHSWLDKAADRGYSKTKANEIHFSLSSEEGIYSLTPLDSDEEDAYSYILDLNEDVSKIQAKRLVPRVEEENEEMSPISDEEAEGFFTNSNKSESEVHNDMNHNDIAMSVNIDQEQTAKFKNVESKKAKENEAIKTQVEERSPKDQKGLKSAKCIEFQPQSNMDLKGGSKEMSANIEKEEGTNSTQDVDLTTELLEKMLNGVEWSNNTSIEDLHDNNVEYKLQTPTVLIVKQEYEVTRFRNVWERETKKDSLIKNLTEDSKRERNTNECKKKEKGNEIETDIKTKKHDSKCSTDISETTNQNHASSRLSRKYQESSETKYKLEASAMTSTFREKGVLIQSVAPSSGLNRIELHIILLLWMLLYCYLIAHNL